MTVNRIYLSPPQLGRGRGGTGLNMPSRRIGSRRSGLTWMSLNGSSRNISACPIIKPGSTITEIGGHIAYFTVLFSQMVGNEGKVIVFEPGTNNLPYIERNTSSFKNAQLITSAVGNYTGRATFFTEELTSQNNRLIKDYYVFKANRKLAGARESYKESTVR